MNTKEQGDYHVIFTLSFLSYALLLCQRVGSVIYAISMTFYLFIYLFLIINGILLFLFMHFKTDKFTLRKPCLALHGH
jgi:uncharacterized protein YybS (DUF2232 family)